MQWDINATLARPGLAPDPAGVLGVPLGAALGAPQAEELLQPLTLGRAG